MPLTGRFGLRAAILYSGNPAVIDDDALGTPRGMTDYSDYLDLDGVIGSRRTFTNSLAEHSFVMVHQAAELYIDDTNRYLAEAKNSLRLNQLPAACDALRIVATNIHHGWMAPWTRLLEMRPQDFQTTIRPHLGSASGFQSIGHRIFELHQGARNHGLGPSQTAQDPRRREMFRLHHESSLYDEAIAVLARNGFDVDQVHLDRDKSRPYEANASVERAWIGVYTDAERFPNLFELGERLIDIDHKFQIWRFCHLKTVQRHIGRRTGTYGTTGVGYLASLTDKEFYPELWSSRTHLARPQTEPA